MEFRILGPLEVVDDGHEVALGGPRPRALLAILLLRRGEVVPSETLIDELYGAQPPRGAAKSIQAHMSRLRKALAGGCNLRSAAGGYALDLDGSSLDLDRFDHHVERGREALARGESEIASEAFADALALWRGVPLADFRYADFAQGAIARLEERRLAVVEDKFDADLALGRHGDVVSALEALVGKHPLRERPRGQLMLALYRSGRQAEALEAYAEARRVLTEELGLEPSGELKMLQRGILEHDPSLAAPSRVEGSPRAPVTDFVGRSEEMETLRAALNDAFGGRGRLVLVSGEPGIGKSRLAEELIAHARSRGARVLVGRCWEAGGAPAYWPWVQSLRTYIRECDAEPLGRQLGPGAADLAQLLPELHDMYPDLPEPPAPESEAARFRLFDAAAQFLDSAARTRPLVVVLDDLHAADEPSLLLLRFLARELGGSRLLVVAAYRDVDPTLRDPLVATLSELAREPVTRRLTLDGFVERDVADYIAVTAGVEPSQATVTEIYSGTDGNPLFVGEIVRLLAAEGRLDETGGHIRIAPGIREVIGSRIRRLSAPCQDVLILASVLGREFSLGVLASMSDLPPDDLLDLLDEAMAERVVTEVPGTSGRLRFAHALIRDTLHDELTTARRLQLHRQAGESLEQVHGAELEPHLAEIALHFQASAPAGARDKAIEYARRAGDQAASLLAYEEAVRLYEMALALVEDDVHRCNLLLALGEAQARAGETPASKESFRAAALLADRLGLAEELAEAALGYGGRLLWEVSRGDEHHIQLLERALAAMGENDSALRVKLLARLAAGPLRDASFPRERRAALSLEALEMARRIGDPATLAYALHGHIEGALLSPERAHERLELSGELVDAALAAGEKEPAVEGHEERFLTLLSLGDRASAEAELAAMEKLAEELRQPAQHWLVTIHRALLALLDGRLTAAEELVSEARRIGEHTQSWNAAVTYGLQLFALRREQGRLTEVEELIQTSADRYPTYVIWRCVVVAVAAELGKEARARAELEALAVDAFECVPFDEEWLVSLTLLADAAAVLDDRVRAAALYELLLPYEDRIAVSYPEISTGSVARSLGRLATTMERWDAAERHLEAAMEMNSEIGARPWLARTQRDYAQMLLRRGAPGDRERSAESQVAARALADELGMVLA